MRNLAPLLVRVAITCVVVGIGSMCRRPIHGPEGLIAVVERLYAPILERFNYRFGA